MRVVVRRGQHLNEEIEVHDAAMKQLVDDTAPQFVAEPGVGWPGCTPAIRPPLGDSSADHQ